MELSEEAAERILERLERMERKLLRLLPIVETLGQLLVRQKTAGERLGLHPTTLPGNRKINKFEEVGRRRTFIEVGDLSTIQKRKPRRKASKK